MIVPIVIAVDVADARRFAEQRGWRKWRHATRRTYNYCRGYTAPVYATDRAQALPEYQQILEVVAINALTVDRGRVA